MRYRDDVPTEIEDFDEFIFPLKAEPAAPEQRAAERRMRSLNLLTTEELVLRARVARIRDIPLKNRYELIRELGGMERNA